MKKIVLLLSLVLLVASCKKDVDNKEENTAVSSTLINGSIVFTDSINEAPDSFIVYYFDREQNKYENSQAQFDENGTFNLTLDIEQPTTAIAYAGQQINLFLEEQKLGFCSNASHLPKFFFLSFRTIFSGLKNLKVITFGCDRYDRNLCHFWITNQR